jgi:L-histidine N-alpha-methyltransferase
MATASLPAVAVALTQDDRAAALLADVRDGLRGPRRSLPSKWLYDDRGCELFDEITELPEYYPTRAERSILQKHADEVARLAGSDTLVELGSGTSTKTRLLIEAFHRAGTLRRFVAFDVAEAPLRAALDTLSEDYPCMESSGVVGDFEQHLDRLPEHGARLVIFLGGTIGNLEPAGRSAFFDTLAGQLEPGEALLLGVDLVKDPARLVSAYDDVAGVTEAFEKNVLEVVNRELGADFVTDRFAYRAVWSETEERIEMGVVSRGAQEVHVRALDLTVELEDGEEIRTEVSAKFRVPGISEELRAAGLEPVAHWTDTPGDFALVLAQRTEVP